MTTLRPPSLEDQQVLKFVKVTSADYISIHHYDDVIMGTMESQITSLTIVYSTVYSDADQRKHQSSTSLAFVWGIHRGPVNSLHKWPVTPVTQQFDDVIMPSNKTSYTLKSWSHEIGCYNDHIALKFDRHHGNIIAKVPVKFQSVLKSLKLNLAALRLNEILL